MSPLEKSLFRIYVLSISILFSFFYNLASLLLSVLGLFILSLFPSILPHNLVIITTSAPMDKSVIVSAVSLQPVKWGRVSNADWQHNLLALFLIVAAPSLVLLNWIALEQYGGSLQTTLQSASSDPLPFLLSHAPFPSLIQASMYASWVLFQYLLYTYVPGAKCVGQRTPGG